MPSQSEQNNFDLVDTVFCNLDEKVKASGLDSLTHEEKVVYYIWGALGVLENGSFSFFFENAMDAAATGLSFQVLGFPVLAECFNLALSLLPSDYFSAEWDRQSKLLADCEEALDILAQRIIDHSDEIELRLGNFIRAHPNFVND